jgi:hypothetical protein
VKNLNYKNENKLQHRGGAIFVLTAGPHRKNIFLQLCKYRRQKHDNNVMFLGDFRGRIDIFSFYIS